MGNGCVSDGCELVPINVDAVVICRSWVSTFAGGPWAGTTDWAWRQAVQRWAHYYCCDDPNCDGDSLTPRDQLETWCQHLLDTFKEPEKTAQALLSSHPVTMMASRIEVGSMVEQLCLKFYAVLLIYELADTPQGRLYEVLGEHSPTTLADFSPSPRVGPGHQLEAWYRGARGHG